MERRNAFLTLLFKAAVRSFSFLSKLSCYCTYRMDVLVLVISLLIQYVAAHMEQNQCNLGIHFQAFLLKGTICKIFD